MAHRWANSGNRHFICLGSQITADSDRSHEIKRQLFLGRKAMTNLDSILKTRDITLPTKVRLVKAMVSPGVVWMWELDHKEGWEQKNWCFWMWFWRRLLRVPWTAGRSNQSILKEISPEYSLERHSEAEAPVLWLSDAKNWLSGEDRNAGKDWRQEEKGMTEHEMVGWHHWPYEHEFKQTLGVGEGQGSLACCSPWGHKESETSERLNWTVRK